MSRFTIEFFREQPLGVEITHRGQVYELVDTRQDARGPDGQVTTTLVWQAGCIKCGTLFQVESPMRFCLPFVMTCPQHRGTIGRAVKFAGAKAGDEANSGTKPKAETKAKAKLVRNGKRYDPRNPRKRLLIPGKLRPVVTNGYMDDPHAA